MNSLSKDDSATHKKSIVALTSVLAAVGLVVFKLVIGVSTGSLGILAEAAHSGLDLVAALVTLFAVRLSSKAPDAEHQFGHGKIENLSALFETFLLLVTCLWIVYEAIQRLFVSSVTIEISIWAFIVMAVSIVVDINRSKMLYKAAREFRSQALEADALHFSTDIWSSSVVILGLFLAWLGNLLQNISPQWKNLEKADSVAALGVAVIVIYVSIRMGMRTVEGLLDSAPKGMDTNLKDLIGSVPGIHNVHSLRIRRSGPMLFIDVHVLVDGQMPLVQAHALTELVEQKVGEAAPEADITIHVEPLPPELGDPQMMNGRSQ